MLERISRNYAEMLVEIGVIEEGDDVDIHAYGFYQDIMLVLNVVTTLIISIILKMIIPCIILNMAFIPIRISAGGHHADNPTRCYINSTLIVSTLLLCLKFIEFNQYVSLLILAIACIIIFLFAPVETDNDPLDDIGRQVYKKRTRCILIIEVIISLIFNFSGGVHIASIIALGLIAEAGMIIAGIIKLKMKNSI